MGRNFRNPSYKVCIIFNLISVIWTGCKIGVATLSISKGRTVKSSGEINTTIKVTGDPRILKLKKKKKFNFLVARK